MSTTRLQTLRKRLRVTFGTIYNDQLWKDFNEYTALNKLKYVEGAATNTTFQHDDLIGLTEEDLFSLSVDGQAVPLSAITDLDAETGEVTFNEDYSTSDVRIEYYAI